MRKTALALAALSWLLGGRALALPPQLANPADALVSTRALGAIRGAGSCTFRVFAPTARSVQVHLYPCPVGGLGRTLELRHNADGTWETTAPSDLTGTYYAYSAAGDDPGFHPERQVPDPYSECVTACDGRSLVVDDHTPVAPRPSFPPQDAIIYEMHLRDFDVDPDCGVQRRGKYLGLTESGRHLTGHPEVKTGLDHLVELGVNTVQIMPFNQFASDERNDEYGWGYDAALYDTPEGWYASERLDASRVRETKEMISELHRRNIRVVMDMVINHTADALRKRAGALEMLAPGYYYRRKPDGSYYDGSGCGNELRSEAPMFRRFIKDTVLHWVNDYGVDGFRFDLLGLMDHRTIAELTAELHRIDPNLLIYGEPWAAGTTPIAITAKGTQKGRGFGVFNDNFRDALKGTVFDPKATGFVQDGGHVEAVRRGIAGSIDDFTAEPTETINYVECHDNHTLWDRLTLSAPAATEAERIQMDKLAAAVILTSQGIPFFQSGQEMLRTKHGEDNSYNLGDTVNMVRWSQKLQYSDVFRYYAGLIRLRKAHPLFRLPNAARVHEDLRFLDGLPARVIGYSLAGSPEDSWKRSLVFFNAAPAAVKVQVPSGHWQVYVDGATAGDVPLTGSPATPDADTVTLPARSAVVLGEPRV